MQLSGILVAAPSAAPSEGHAALSFGATPPPAALEGCAEVPEDDAVIPFPLTPLGAEVAAVVPVAVKGADAVPAALAPPDNVPNPNPVAAFAVPAAVAPTTFPGPRLDTPENLAVALLGRPAKPYEGEEF